MWCCITPVRRDALSQIAIPRHCLPQQLPPCTPGDPSSLAHLALRSRARIRVQARVVVLEDVVLQALQACTVCDEMMHAIVSVWCGVWWCGCAHYVFR